MMASTDSKITLQEIASMIDHSLLQPTMTDRNLIAGFETALKWNVASVCVKPYAVDLCQKYLMDSPVKVCTVIGFPQGSNSTSIKKIESLQAIADGAVELDMVINIGKVLSNEWEYVKTEIAEINEICLQGKAILKVIFENDYMPNEGYKIMLTKMCREIKVAFVKTSTGYGYNKLTDGHFATNGATLADCKLMVEHAGTIMQVKAAGGIRTLNDLLAFRAIGVTRIGATATEAILTEFIESYKTE
jgi:deoxyribose-phosphate aldolase